MDRDTTNRIRFVLEELVPPALRDSGLMRLLFRGYWGSLINDIERFRERAHMRDEREYARIYDALPRIHEDTDLSERCVERILADIEGRSVLDVGCGTGTLLSRIAEHHADAELAGVDFQIDAALRARFPSMRFEESKIESLPFEDDAFDTVVCTHVLEHILELPAAVRELRRVCRRRLLIVVPKEREYRFTFNPHLHFFPYRHSFLKFMLPVPESAHCELIGRDIYYREIPEA